MEERLAIDRGALEQVCVEHPDSLYKVATAVTHFRSMRDAKKKELEEKEASLYLDIRHRASVQDERITEAEIKAQMTLDRDRRRLIGQLAEANELLARWETLRDAFLQRSYMIKELVSLYLARYYGDPARGAENRMHDFASEQIQTARRERSQESRFRRTSNGGV
jgi:hypothetical protein